MPVPAKKSRGRPKRDRNLAVWAFKMHCAGVAQRKIQAWLNAQGLQLRDRGQPEHPYYRGARRWAEDGGVTLTAAIEARLTAAVIDGDHRVEGFAAIARKLGMSRQRLTYGLSLLFPKLVPRPIETQVRTEQEVRGQIWTGLPCKPPDDE